MRARGQQHCEVAIAGGEHGGTNIRCTCTVFPTAGAAFEGNDDGQKCTPASRRCRCRRNSPRRA
eukprot:11919031-Alexandrium_andersonii.AAC.2